MLNLRHHADRAVARHMLTLFALAVGVVMIAVVGMQFIEAARTLADTIWSIEVK